MIAYRDDVDGVVAADLEGFFEGWPDHPAPDVHLRLLRGSDVVTLALDEGRVVGFATAITDGVLSAYIPLLEVLPDYQGQGIGNALVRRILERLDGIYMIDTCCDEDVVSFYEKFDMRRGIAMMRRDFSAQSGRRE